ncbi:MAG TPA: iron-containing alcohol dehydrogenase [Anaerolineaceae bacterium]|nr:iron-containing alcohol dehydrogenase [Anaerolineaceae bacterium]HPN50588.1 iron-containing alcohol dehydrogenase [Anaerolineaceae bacterium]
MNFEFATATRIIFGDGRLKEIGELARPFGRNALVITTEGGVDPVPLIDYLEEEGITSDLFLIRDEPTIDVIKLGTDAVRGAGSELIIGIGGGSVMDAAKAIAAMLTNPGSLTEYLEVIGQGRQLTRNPAPVIAIPTTSGTGAEVTRNAVLVVPEKGYKVSLRSPLLYPRVALVDPQLSWSMPPQLTAATGMDAMSQLIEPYVSLRANPMADLFCLDGLRRAAGSLEEAFLNGNNAAARREMSLASLYGGLALANAGLGAVHGLAAPLGGMYQAPHGMICARLLAPVMAENVRVLRKTAPDSPALARYAEVARLLTGSPSASIEEGITWVENLVQRLQIPGLTAYGLDQNDFGELAEKGMAASSMKSNPVVLSQVEIQEILAKAL